MDWKHVMGLAVDMTLVIACWILWGAVLVFLIVLGLRFLRLYRPVPNECPDEQLPKVAVLLALRGADPFLEDCLRGVFSLDYPHHEVHVVVDSQQDPAWAVVERIRQDLQPINVTVCPLTEFASTCSLKVNSLLQAIASLDESVEIIAWLDADAIPYRRWLRDLIVPFRDPQVGIAHGFRWYNPREQSMGSLVRYIWNAAAVPQMYAMKIAWGGSCAIRRSSFDAARLSDQWSRVLFEDTFTSHAVLDIGQRVAVAAPVTLFNSESIDLASCTGFVARQLLNLRLYHRAWPFVLWSGVATVVSVFANLALAVWAIVTADRNLLIGCGLAWLTFAVGVGLLVLRAECIMQRLAASRGESYTRPSLRLLPAGLLVIFVYGAALWQAAFTRTVTWRGIQYRIDGPFRVTRMNYAPYIPLESTGVANQSL